MLQTNLTIQTFYGFSFRNESESPEIQKSESVLYYLLFWTNSLAFASSQKTS